MKNLLKFAMLIFLSACFYQTAFACGAPQTISGRATNSNGGVSNARIHLEVVGGGQTYSALTNGFGYYQIQDVTPCILYQISISAKATTFIDPVRQLYVAGDAEGYEVNFETDGMNLVNVCIYQTASGKVSDNYGNGISAFIEVKSLLDIDPVLTRTVRSNNFGNYSVPNLISCENYEFRVVSNRYSFTPEILTVIPSEQSENLDFTGTE